MGKDFSIHLDATVDAVPEQIWDAIATGPGISSWYLGRTEIDGDTVHTTFGDIPMPPATVTARQPTDRFAHRTDTTADGRFLATEYLIEGRNRAATVLRTVTSGFLPGEDWADEYEAMRFGTELFFATLVEYLRYFPGRPATPVTVFGPPVTDWPATWASLHKTLGLSPDPRPGDRTTDGGQIYFTNPQTLGIRTPQGLYRYIRGFHGTLVAAHQIVTGDTHPERWATLLRTLKP
ncbi:MAG TPA: SRPBCC domain-containing protein [Actinoplanes sp.]|jgi:hypothetical protein